MKQQINRNPFYHQIDQVVPPLLLPMCCRLTISDLYPSGKMQIDDLWLGAGLYGGNGVPESNYPPKNAS
jgi:hypothetical protein